MKKIAIAAAAALTLALAGCTTITPTSITPDASMLKRGEAGPALTLGSRAGLGGIPLLTADISLATAAENGGITKIATVDTSVKQILFLYWTTTIVTGE